MASNFKIALRQDNANVLMKLSGDFDGSAACQLIHLLKTYGGKGLRVLIDTSRISSIHPFGVRLFQKDCLIHNLSGFLTFTGRHSAGFWPESIGRI